MTRRSTVLLAWLGWLSFVVYGSLVPLDYTAMPWDQAVAAFRNVPFLKLGIDSRADWVANGVLYAPLGFLSARLLKTWLPRLPDAVAMPLAFAGCAALAVAVEFTQLFFPPRTVSQNDLIAETIGSAAGVLLAPVLSGWLARLGVGWFVGGGRLFRHLLEGYAVAYVLLCFFPYDLLLSGAEVQGKWASGLWGWVLAPHERGLLLALIQLVVETGLVLPIGVLLARHVGRAVLVGAALGLLIEIGQFFVASGVSQGASVLTRAAGVALGAVLAPALGRGGVPAVKAVLGRHAWWLLLLYLPVLLFVNGWFREPWQGVAAAAGVWRGLRLMPFYYHYWTTEALALFSLGSVALMYLPAVLLAWARGLPRGVILAGVVVLTLAVEISKLFITGLRPDPTNLLVSTAASAVTLALLGLAAQPRRADAGTRAMPSAPVRPASTWPLLWMLLPLVLVGTALWAAWFPAFPRLLLALLCACAVAVWMRPLLALALIPAALPVLDLAPWSGRFFWDEFDVLQAVCITVALFRTPVPAGQSHRLRPLTVAFGLLGLSLWVSTLVALLPWQGVDLNSFSSYYSPFNALRIVKGALWAGLFVLLWRRLADSGAARTQALGGGMAAGLALTVAFVLWERAQAVGLLDFGADFRVSGPIAAMHKGGAYLECWLAVAAAFVMASVVGRQKPRPSPFCDAFRVLGLVLLAATGYAVMVTFSRNGYVALIVALVLAALAAARARAGAAEPVAPARCMGRRLAWAGVALALVAAAAGPVLMGGFARERLARSADDLALRQAHWADALQMRDRDGATQAFGMGLGTFPVSHFLRSSEPVRAASYSLVREGDGTFLRLGGGATLYIEQGLPGLPADELVLRMDLRSTREPASLAVFVCRKWGLSSQTCVQGQAVARSPPFPPPPTAGAWQPAELRLDVSALRAQAGVLGKPVKLSLLTPEGGARVDVRGITLAAATGGALLSNGDFSADMDHWFFATDVDPPWHIHSLPVAVLFDQGWFGVFAWGLVLAVALASGMRLAWRGQSLVPAALAGAAAFLTSGTLNTLIDAPRFLALLLVLLWLAAAHDRQGERPAA